MPRVVANTRHSGDRRRDPGEGPEGRAEPEGLGPPMQGRLHCREVGGREFRLPARTPSRPQGAAPALGPVAVPPEHALATDAELARNGRIVFLCCCEQAGGSEAPCFQTMEVPSRSPMRMHTPMLHEVSPDVTILYEIQ